MIKEITLFSSPSSLDPGDACNNSFFLSIYTAKKTRSLFGSKYLTNPTSVNTSSHGETGVGYFEMLSVFLSVLCSIAAALFLIVARLSAIACQKPHDEVLVPCEFVSIPDEHYLLLRKRFCLNLPG